MKTLTKVKIILFVVLIFLYNALKQFISPLIANDLALNQMHSTVDSNLWIQLYTYFSNYSILIFIVIAILLFNKNVINFINKIKENDKKEKKDEEN